MKKIQFNNQSAQKVYDSYIRRAERTIKSLSKLDQKEIVMELNSHIYAALQPGSVVKEEELDAIIKITDKLGDPEIILSSMVEEKSLERASRTFNPLHIAKALVINIKNGLIYSVYAFLYLAIALCLALLGLKLVVPESTGTLVCASGTDSSSIALYNTDSFYEIKK